MFEITNERLRFIFEKTTYDKGEIFYAVKDS